MLLKSTLRDRRLENRQIEIKQQFVVFWIRQAWFALPIASMHRAIPIEVDVPVITQAGIEVPIMDIGEKIFPNQPLINTSLNLGTTEVSSQRSIILLENKLDRNKLTKTESLIAIVIDSQPVLLRISDSEFIPMIEDSKTQFNSEFVKFMTPAFDRDRVNRPAIFLLEPELLI
jgi:chemotaxis signal transduction protein